MAVHVVGPRETENISKVFEIFVVVHESLAANCRLVETQGLDLRAGGPIEHQDALVEQSLQLFGDITMRHKIFLKLYTVGYSMCYSTVPSHLTYFSNGLPASAFTNRLSAVTIVESVLIARAT